MRVFSHDRALVYIAAACGPCFETVREDRRRTLGEPVLTFDVNFNIVTCARDDLQ